MPNYGAGARAGVGSGTGSGSGDGVGSGATSTAGVSDCVPVSPPLVSGLVVEAEVEVSTVLESLESAGVVVEVWVSAVVLLVLSLSFGPYVVTG